VEHVDDIAVALERSGDGRFKRRPGRHRPESQHVEILLFVPGAQLIPILGRFDVLHEFVVNFLCLAGEIFLDHFVARHATIRLPIFLPRRYGCCNK
jgi:hypothetical protein